MMFYYYKKLISLSLSPFSFLSDLYFISVETSHQKKKILSMLRHLIMDDKMSPFHLNSLPSHTYFFFSCHKERTKYPWLDFSTLGNRLHIPSTIYYTPATHHAIINVKLNPKSFVRLFLALVYGSLERYREGENKNIGGKNL